MTSFDIRAGLHVEEVEGTVLVLDPASSTVVELTGDQAEAFRLAQAGTDLVPDHLATPMAGLVELGLVTAPGWNRRRVLLAGGAAAAAAVVAVALPSPAAAQSAPGGGGGGTGEPTVPGAPTITNLFRRRDGGYLIFFAGGADNGSPLEFSTSYVNGVPVNTGNATGGTVVISGGPGDSIQLSNTNGIGEGPLSAPVIGP